MKETQRSRTIPILAVVTGTGTLIFWACFFTVGLAPANPPACYFAFERAIPMADIPLAMTLIAGGIFALKTKTAGKRLLPIAGGALIYVGLLDISFNYQNGMYALSVADMLTNGFINLWCLGVGTLLAFRFETY